MNCPSLTPVSCPLIHYYRFHSHPIAGAFRFPSLTALPISHTSTYPTFVFLHISHTSPYPTFVFLHSPLFLYPSLCLPLSPLKLSNTLTIFSSYTNPRPNTTPPKHNATRTHLHPKTSPSYRELDIGRATLTLTLEDFAFFIEEHSLDHALVLSLPANVRYVVLQLIELGGDHLDQLMHPALCSSKQVCMLLPIFIII